MSLLTPLGFLGLIGIIALIIIYIIKIPFKIKVCGSVDRIFCNFSVVEKSDCKCRPCSGIECTVNEGINHIGSGDLCVRCQGIRHPEILPVRKEQPCDPSAYRFENRSNSFSGLDRQPGEQRIRSSALCPVLGNKF